MIERWLVAIRDHPERPAPLQCHVLTMLALRMDWKTGTGYASTGQLMTDAKVAESTVRRATSWARKTGLLIQTRRGHRLGSGQVAASEWKLTQPVTGERLTSSQPVNGAISTGQQNGLNRSVGMHHQELSSSRTSSSSRARPKPCPRCRRLPHTGHSPGCPNDEPTALGAIIDGIQARNAP
jgi:hypothetical protein